MKIQEHRSIKFNSEPWSATVKKPFVFFPQPHNLENARALSKLKSAHCTELTMVAKAKIQSIFEDCTKPQFEKWISSFIPEWQYGFVSKHGSVDYGAALAFTMGLLHGWELHSLI